MLNKPLDYIFPNPPEGLDPTQLDSDKVPQHVAVIMDGNGRWAKARGKNRLYGHNAGVGAVRETIRCASDVGVRYLTIYSFSSENWKRPQDEVDGLMNLFAKTMAEEVDALDEERVRIMTIGREDALPEKTRKAFDDAWEQTKDNDGMTLIIAVNYGGRQELVDAVKSYTDECRAAEKEGREPEELSEEVLARHLYTRDIPDPDLLIRTSGEMRVSNFLLWQIAYTEFVCTDVLWPDFDRYEFLRALLEYQGRDRRYGAVS